MQEVVGLSPIVSTKENTGHVYDRYFLWHISLRLQSPLSTLGALIAVVAFIVDMVNYGSHFLHFILAMLATHFALLLAVSVAMAVLFCHRHILFLSLCYVTFLLELCDYLTG
jgi:hypothetical protein